MAINEFKQFAGASGAYVYTPSAYAQNNSIINGVQNGQADPTLYNTTARQASTIIVSITDFINGTTGQNTLDDGTIGNILNNFSLGQMVNNYCIDASTDSTGSSPNAWAPIQEYTSIVPYLIAGKLQDGLQIRVKVAFTNTGSATFSFCGIASSTIVKPDGSNLSGGELIQNQVYTLTYLSSTNKWLLNYQLTGVTAQVGNSSNLLATTQFVTTAISNGIGSITGVPTGSIFGFSGANAPSGYLACPTTAAAAQYSITTYSALYAVISTLWNSGTVPTGYFCIPWGPQGYSLLNGPSTAVGTQTVGQNLTHTHPPAVGTNFMVNPGNWNGSNGSYGNYNGGSQTGPSTNSGPANLAAGMYTRFIVKT